VVINVSISRVTRDTAAIVKQRVIPIKPVTRACVCRLARPVWKNATSVAFFSRLTKKIVGAAEMNAAPTSLVSTAYADNPVRPGITAAALSASTCSQTQVIAAIANKVVRLVFPAVLDTAVI